MVYHVHVGSRYFRPNKLLFQNGDDLDHFLYQMLEGKLPKFVNTEAKENFERRYSSKKERDNVVLDAVTITRIDTKSVPEWDYMFMGGEDAS